MSVPVLRRRMFAPRKNSWVIVAATRAHSEKQIPDAHTRTPSAARAAAVPRHAIAGHMNWYTRLLRVDLRHASNGPAPVRNRRTSAIGVIHLLKKGPATVSRLPVTASLSVGNIVPNSTKNAENSRIQLLTRNAASRDIHESRSLRAFKSGRRQITRPKLTTRMATMNPVNGHANTGSEPNACTD